MSLRAISKDSEQLKQLKQLLEIISETKYIIAYKPRRYGLSMYQEEHYFFRGTVDLYDNNFPFESLINVD